MMNPLRTSLHLALVLALTSLTCGIGAACAAMGETCCCMMEDGGSPCTEVSGGGDAPAAPAPASAVDSGERFSVAIADATPLGSSPGATASAPDGRARQVTPAASAPLYLSHCAFLC